MFEESIKEGKPRPSFDGTGDYQVFVTLSGEVQNPAFLRFLERIGPERTARFSTRDLLALDHLARDERVPDELRSHVDSLENAGVVECIGRGKNRRCFLSRSLYEFLGQKGTYTRKRGLDRETNKQLLLKHIRDNAAVGSPLSELKQVLPSLSEDQVQRLVRDLKDAGLIAPVGKTRGALWFPAEQAGVAESRDAAETT
jgi:ATP-dependent DNA helicase RecG